MAISPRSAATLKRLGSESIDESVPLEVEVNMSRAEWLAENEVAVTSTTPDPLADRHDD